MAYTTRESINDRRARNGLNSRPAGENAAGGDLSSCVIPERNWAADGHNVIRIVRLRRGAARRERLFFSENLGLPGASNARWRAAI